MKCYRFIVMLFIMFILTIMQVKAQVVVDINVFQMNLVRPEYVKKLKYSVVDKHLISVDFVWAKNVTDFSIRVSFNIISKDNRRINVVNIRTNGCQLLGSISKNAFLKIALKEIYRTGNMPKKCPMLATQEYYIHNYSVTADHFPPFMPMTSYATNVDFIVYDTYIGTIVIEGELRKIGRRNTLKYTSNI